MNYLLLQNWEEKFVINLIKMDLYQIQHVLLRLTSLVDSTIIITSESIAIYPECKNKENYN